MGFLSKDEEPHRQGGKKAAKQPPILMRQTQEIITNIEKYLGAPLLTYFNSGAGSVCGNDAISINDHLKASISKSSTSTSKATAAAVSHRLRSSRSCATTATS